ncbi:hypothetical protein HY024_03215 [Candidatus Curtissbacteria bacterium]|nr:hypothetical protein [Candidatus Curtissbacteria bacterium]
MDQDLKQKTQDNITKAQSVMVAVSPDSGLDGMAAGLGLFLAFQKLGKSASIMAQSPTAGDAQKLYGVDQIGKAQGVTNLVVTVENAVDTVDRVSHFLDGDKLKLTLHAFPGSTGPTKDQVSFAEEMTQPDVIFAIGFTTEDNLKQYVTQVQNISPNCWLVNINTQDMGQIFAQLNVFDPNASSLSEITAQLIADLALPVDEDIAFNLYEGISQATTQFNPGHVGTNTFEIASWLIKFGAGKASFAGSSKLSQTSFQPQPRPQFQSQPQPQTQPISSTQPQSSAFSQMLNIGQQIPTESQTQPQNQAQPQAMGEVIETPITQVEREKGSSGDDWLNPPKIYSGSKSFDTKE